jgi:hypothetical protein
MSRGVAAVNWVERRRLFVYPALVSLGVGMLVSCAEKPPLVPPVAVAIARPPPPPLPTPPRRGTIPLPAHKPIPPAENPVDTPEAGTQADTPSGGNSDMALASPAPAPPNASELIGLDQPSATHLLGAATEKSEAPPATVWRYRNGACELDLFFYLDLRSGKMRTLHYAFKGDTADPASRQDCLRSLIVARGG